MNPDLMVACVEFQERWAAGERAVLNQMCRKYPTLAGELTEWALMFVHFENQTPAPAAPGFDAAAQRGIDRALRAILAGN